MYQLLGISWFAHFVTKVASFGKMSKWYPGLKQQKKLLNQNLMYVYMLIQFTEFVHRITVLSVVIDGQ